MLQTSMLDRWGKTMPKAENVAITDDSAMNANSIDCRAPQTHLSLKVGKSQCKCVGCGHYFFSVSAFDRHQYRDLVTHETVCMHPLDVVDRKGNQKPMVKNYLGWWVTELREEGSF